MRNFQKHYGIPPILQKQTDFRNVLATAVKSPTVAYCNLDETISCHCPAGIYLLKVNNRNTRTRCEICSKLTIKIPDDANVLTASFWYPYCYLWIYFTPCSSVTIINLEHVIAGWVVPFCTCLKYRKRLFYVSRECRKRSVAWWISCSLMIRELLKTLKYSVAFIIFQQNIWEF